MYFNSLTIVLFSRCGHANNSTIVSYEYETVCGLLNFEVAVGVQFASITGASRLSVGATTLTRHCALNNQMCRKPFSRCWYCSVRFPV